MGRLCKHRQKRKKRTRRKENKKKRKRVRFKRPIATIYYIQQRELNDALKLLPPDQRNILKQYSVQYSVIPFLNYLRVLCTGRYNWKELLAKAEREWVKLSKQEKLPFYRQARIARNFYRRISRYQVKT